MNKDEILKKSRKENKNLDVFEKEVMRLGGNAAASVAVILASVFLQWKFILKTVQIMDFTLLLPLFRLPYIL